MQRPLLCSAALLALFSGCAGSSQDGPESSGTSLTDTTSNSGAAILLEPVDTMEHDPSCFTQGLAFHDGLIYESSGRYGISYIEARDPVTGEVVNSVPLPDTVFAEGIAFIGDTLYAITWLEGVVLMYRTPGLEYAGAMEYSGQGWGLASTGSSLIMSNGGDTLFWRDPRDFSITRRLPVTLDGHPVRLLNELEHHDGLIYANLWTTSLVAAIDTLDGAVRVLYDGSGLLTPAEAGEADVMNGLAWDPARGAFVVTGKLWPRSFVVVMEGASLDE